MNGRRERNFVYDSLVGKILDEDNLNNPEFTADVSIILGQVGQHIKHHYGERGYLRLLDHVNCTRLDRDMKNHTRPGEFRD